MTVVMLCVCTKRVCVRFTELVCKALRLAFSCQTSAISFPFIPIPWKDRIIAMGCSTSVQSRKLQSHIQKLYIFRKKMTWYLNVLQRQYVYFFIFSILWTMQNMNLKKTTIKVVFTKFVKVVLQKRLGF